MHVLRAIDKGFVEDLQVFAGDKAVYCGIGHHGGRVVPNHAVPVAGRGPFREELVLTGNVRKALENLTAYVWIDKV